VLYGESLRKLDLLDLYGFERSFSRRKPFIEFEFTGKEGI